MQFEIKSIETDYSERTTTIIATCNEAPKSKYFLLDPIPSHKDSRKRCFKLKKLNYDPTEGYTATMAQLGYYNLIVDQPHQNLKTFTGLYTLKELTDIDQIKLFENEACY